MQMNIERIKNLIDKNMDFLKKTYSVKSIGIFGSVATGQSSNLSDVDLLVEFQEPIGMFKFIELEEYLSKVLARRVDLVTKKALKDAIRKDVLREVIYV